MTTWCVDANVVIATLLEEDASDAAQDFWMSLSPVDQVVTAQVLHPECLAVIRRKVAQGLLTEDEGRTKVRQMLALPMAVETSADQFSRAFDWALELGRIRMHDLQYIAVAQLRQATIVTVDGGMRQAAVEQGVAATLLR